MKLLFVHEVNWRRKVVYEIHDFPELLSLRGHEIVFIDYPEGERHRGFRRILDLKTEVRPNQSRAHEGSSVEVRTPGRVFPPPLDRLFASVTQAPAIWRALRDEDFDAVVLYGVPTNGWQTVRIAKRFGIPVLFRAIDVSHALRRTFLGWLIRRAERSVLKRADWVSANNEALRDYCVENGADQERISVDYPGLDLERFKPAERDDGLARYLGIRPGDEVVLFMGTFFRFSGLSWFLEAMTPQLRVREDLRVVLIGGGEDEKSLRRLVERLAIDRAVRFTGVIEYERLASYLRLADVAVNTLHPGLATHSALPGKVLQYLGSGVPTVSTPLEGLMGLIPEGKGVVYREEGEPFANEVFTLLEDHKMRREVGELGRALVTSECEWDRSLAALEDSIGQAILYRG